jgi:hypothetical protein
MSTSPGIPSPWRDFIFEEEARILRPPRQRFAISHLRNVRAFPEFKAASSA